MNFSKRPKPDLITGIKLEVEAQTHTPPLDLIYTTYLRISHQIHRHCQTADMNMEVRPR